MQVHIERLAEIGARVLETRGDADHGQGDGERVVGLRGVEGHVHDGGAVDDAVDLMQVVGCYMCARERASVFCWGVRAGGRNESKNWWTRKKKRSQTIGYLENV